MTRSEPETENLAGELLSPYLPSLTSLPLVFALEGELGAGKTVFVKGLAKALGIKKVIRSPSFVLMFEYLFEINGNRGKLAHADMWRVESEEELANIGLAGYLTPGNIVAVEWGNNIGKFIKETEKKAAVVRLRFLHRSESEREITVI